MSTTQYEQLGHVSPVTAGEPVDARVERSRAKLLAAATDLLVAHGPAALTVDGVAERSGVAKSTLYRHWPSREALMVDVLRENMPRMPAFDSSLRFESRLRGYLRALADAFSDPEWARILPALFSLRNQFPDVCALTDSDRDAKVAMLTELLDAGVAEGAIPAGLDAHDVAATLFGPLLMCVLTGETDTVHQVASFAADRFLASYRRT